MSDDARVRQRMLEQARAYSRHYPSVIPRLKAALDSRDPNLRDLVRALTDAYERSERQRERQLRDGWSLSPQEIRVTLHLVDGGTVATCAEQLGVAESTIRTHLKSVFVKTSLNRQAQLPSLLQNNPGMSDSDQAVPD